MMASMGADKEQSQAEMEDLARRMGLSLRSKTFRARSIWYRALRRDLIDAGYSVAKADEFISRFMSHYITVTHLSEISFALRQALGHRTVRRDPDLTVVIDAWDRLPEAVRTGIVAIVRAIPKS